MREKDFWRKADVNKKRETVKIHMGDSIVDWKGFESMGGENKGIYKESNRKLAKDSCRLLWEDPTDF